MTLIGALQLGQSSLAAQQVGLTVTGNNITNAGTEGYSRQVVRLTPSTPVAFGQGQSLGTGVTIDSIERQVNAALDESLRDATSDQNGAGTLDNVLGRLETTFGILNDNDLSARMSDFFNSFSTLANNPSDTAQRSVVIQNGVSLTGYLQSLRTQIGAIREDAQAQIQAQATSANALVHTIANLNQQITVSEAGAGSASNLRDQRDIALGKLSQLMDIRSIDMGNGQVNVLVGSVPIVQGSTTRGISTSQSYDAAGNMVTINLTFADNGDTLTVSSGKLGALVNGRDNYVTPAVAAVDSIASGLISTVNGIHSQGQGLSGFSNVTGATQVLSPTATLNAGEASTGIAFTPVNGTFNLHIKDQNGQITTKQIIVNLSGTGPQSTLNSLAADISAAGGGIVNAIVDSGGHLQISSNNNHVSFTFSDDTSGALASLGINTFFTGKNASDIQINTVLKNTPNLLATARDNITGSNRNAQALALAGSATVAHLNGRSIKDFYSSYIGELASHAKNASDDVTAHGLLRDTLYAQREAISGVSLDEEAINLTKYQQAFQGTARYINVITQMMETVLGLVR